METSPKETVVRVQLSSQDRTILKNITRAINGLTLALKRTNSDVSIAGDTIQRLTENLTEGED